MKKIILFFFITLITNYSYADNLYSQIFEQCIEGANGNDFEISECIDKEYLIQDQNLNQVYKKLLSQLSDERKKTLRDAQRLWIAYTEKNCEFYHDPDGGTIGARSARECMLMSTVSRVNELNNFIQ